MQVEFYGIPRMRAGVAAVELPEVATLGDALRELARRFPEFARDCLQEGELSRQCIANLDGARFVRDRATPLADGRVLLILSADAGG